MKHARLRPALALAVLFTSPTLAQTPGQVLAEGRLGFAGPLAPGDEFGRAVCAPGDVDGDGTPDLAVGAPGDDEGSTDAGAVWLLLLDESGDVRTTIKHATFSGGPQLGLAAGGRFGASLAAVGDVNGDGTPDLAVGAPTTGTVDGRVWVLLLQPDGTRLAQPSFDAADLGLFLVIELGLLLAPAGDVDHDDVPDVLVAGRSILGTQNPFVVLLDAAGTGSGVQEPDASAFGDETALGLLDDRNADGFGELVLGDALYDGTELFEGRIGLVLRGPDGSVEELRLIGAGAGGFAAELGFDDRFGRSVAQLADLDGNGVRDLAVGALDDGSFPPGEAPGGVWELFLSGDGTVTLERFVTAGRAGFAGPLLAGDGFGAALAWVAGSGEGVGALFVGAPGDDTAGTDAGAAWRLELAGEEFPPAVVVRNGTHVNPLLLASSSSPRTGAPWTAEVDASAYALATTTFLVGYDAPDRLPLGFGELLVLLEPFGGTNQFVDAAPVTGGFGRHVLAVPNDPAFLGYTVHVQGLLAGGGPRLTSALRVTVGAP